MKLPSSLMTTTMMMMMMTMSLIFISNIGNCNGTSIIGTEGTTVIAPPVDKALMEDEARPATPIIGATTSEKIDNDSSSSSYLRPSATAAAATATTTPKTTVPRFLAESALEGKCYSDSLDRCCNKWEACISYGGVEPYTGRPITNVDCPSCPENCAEYNTCDRRCIEVCSGNEYLIWIIAGVVGIGGLLAICKGLKKCLCGD